MQSDTLILPENLGGLLRPNMPDGSEHAGCPLYSVTHFSRGDKNLYYIAAKHENFVESPTRLAVAEAIGQFAPKYIVIETDTGGRINSSGVIAELYKTAPEERSEILYAAYLANEKNIPFIGGEPTDADIFRKMEGKERDVGAYYILRQIALMNKYNHTSASRIDVRGDGYIEGIAVQVIPKKLRENCAPLERPFTYGEIEAWGNAKTLKSNLLELTDNDFGPYPNGTPAQKLSYEVAQIRDRHILGTITDGLNSRGTVLVVYGNGHLAAQRPVLEKMFGSEGITFNIVPDIAPRPRQNYEADLRNG